MVKSIILNLRKSGKSINSSKTNSRSVKPRTCSFRRCIQWHLPARSTSSFPLSYDSDSSLGRHRKISDISHNQSFDNLEASFKCRKVVHTELSVQPKWVRWPNRSRGSRCNLTKRSKGLIWLSARTGSTELFHCPISAKLCCDSQLINRPQFICFGVYIHWLVKQSECHNYHIPNKYQIAKLPDERDVVACLPAFDTIGIKLIPHR